MASSHKRPSSWTFKFKTFKSSKYFMIFSTKKNKILIIKLFRFPIWLVLCAKPYIIFVDLIFLFETTNAKNTDKIYYKIYLVSIFLFVRKTNSVDQTKILCNLKNIKNLFLCVFKPVLRLELEFILLRRRNEKLGSFIFVKEQCLYIFITSPFELKII